MVDIFEESKESIANLHPMAKNVQHKHEHSISNNYENVRTIKYGEVLAPYPDFFILRDLFVQNQIEEKYWDIFFRGVETWALFSMDYFMSKSTK